MKSIHPIPLSIALLVLATGVLGALSVGCKKTTGGFATGGESEERREVETGPIKCISEGWYEVRLDEDSPGDGSVCKFVRRINLRDGCEVLSLRLYGAGDSSPADAGIWVITPRIGEDGFPEDHPNLSPGDSTEDAEDMEWSTEIPVEWSSLEEEMIGRLEVVITPKEGDSCDSVGPLYIRIQTDSPLTYE